MPPSIQDLPVRSELFGIVIDNGLALNECILYPPNATDEELETRWIQAMEGNYVRLDDVR